MKQFWESSPEWQRERELSAELVTATKAKDEAGERALYCIAFGIDSPLGDVWRERRQAFKDAFERYSEALGSWSDALKAFEASPAGQARARALKDPLAQTEQEAA